MPLCVLTFIFSRIMEYGEATVAWVLFREIITTIVYHDDRNFIDKSDNILPGVFINTKGFT